MNETVSWYDIAILLYCIRQLRLRKSIYSCLYAIVCVGVGRAAESQQGPQGRTSLRTPPVKKTQRLSYRTRPRVMEDTRRYMIDIRWRSIVQHSIRLGKEVVYGLSEFWLVIKWREK